MQIKKSTLKLILISLAIVVVAGGITLPIYYKHRKEKQRTEELTEYIAKAIEREYKDLLRDYDYYVKEALDYSNSRSSRERYINKINKLLGYSFYCRDSYSPSYDFANEYKEKNKEAKSILRDRAIEKARERLLE